MMHAGSAGARPPGGHFWPGKRVFLTGHTGFKGGWLALWLRRLGAQVTGYSLEPPTRPNLFELACVARNVDSVIGDVRDYDRLARAMRSARPEVVFHLAAQPLVRQSYVDPRGTYATNVLGTVNLLEAVRSTPGVRAALIVTSDKCYENREPTSGYRETDRLGGHDPYSSSKACAELVTQSFRDAFFSSPGDGALAAIASARAGNMIGGGDWAEDRLIPDCVRAALERRPVRIRHPGAVRPWQHVLDPLDGYLRLAERLAQDGRAWAEAWNFGPEEADARTVRWLVERFAQRWGASASWEPDRQTHPVETTMLTLDSSKARQRLGWRPAWHIEQALERTVAWYKTHASGGDLLAFTLAQIEEFEGAQRLEPAT